MSTQAPSTPDDAAHQPDATNEGVSTSAPAEGGDDTPGPDEGSAKG